MACKVVGKICKVAGETLPLQIDLTDFLERKWDAKRGAGIYPLGSFVRPTAPNRNGFEFEATEAGQVAPEEPAWPSAEDEVVQDGSVEWTCRPISNSSLLKTIADADWDGGGFTIDNEGIINTDGRQLVSAMVEDDLDPGDYEVRVTVTFSDGHVETFGVKVKME